jgi:hypothetical protein
VPIDQLASSPCEPKLEKEYRRKSEDVPSKPSCSETGGSRTTYDLQVDAPRDAESAKKAGRNIEGSWIRMGGDYKDHKDFMHFEYGGADPSKIKGLDKDSPTKD